MADYGAVWGDGHTSGFFDPIVIVARGGVDVCDGAHRRFVMKKEAGMRSCADCHGFDFNGSEADATQGVMALAAGTLDEAGYAAWLRENAKGRRGGRRSRAG
ncbi:MAG TPA: hypothetical protein VEH47_02425 [Candidatus Acidoferrales bacterium]|nr:hypothetical protein [Candidatus Acidoferrales bacterium]